MKTRQELNLEYWGRVHDMCKGTALEGREWECVKSYGRRIEKPPFFNNAIKGSYELAVCIVEDKPVFVGDPLFIKNNKHPNVNWQLFEFWNNDIRRLSKDWTWKKPKQKQTFSIECSGKNMGIVIADIPCPVKSNRDGSWVARSIFMHEYSYEFATVEDRNTALQSIKQILDAAEKANKGE